MRTVLIAAAIIVLAAGGGVAVRSLREQSAHQPATTTGTPLDARALVLHNGDTVRVNGEVLAVPKRPVHLCAPYLDALDTSGNNTSKFTYCPGAVDVTGVDLSTLWNRQVSGGTVYGMAQCPTPGPGQPRRVARP